MKTTPPPLRILLIEDNEHDRLVFRRAFKKSQVAGEIIECVRAEEALKLLRPDAVRSGGAPPNFDLLVIDHGLPGISGLDLCKELVDEDSPWALVLLTGVGSEQLAVEALKAGVDDYLVKDTGRAYLELLPVVLPDVVRKHVDRLARKRAEDLISVQRDLGLALSLASGLDETVSLCVEAAIRVSGMDCGGVYLVDEPSGNLDLVFHKGLPPAFIKSASHYDADSPSARLCMAGNPIYTLYQELGVPLDEAKHHEGLRAVAIIPVHYANRVIACLNIASHTLDEVSAFDRTALETIATQIGNAISRAKSEERYRTLVENVNIGIYRNTGDPHGRFIQVNPALAQIHGYDSVEAFMELPVSEFYYNPADRERFVEKIKKQGFVENEELQLRKKDGTRIWASCTARVQYDETGAVKWIDGVIEDITHRKRLEEQEHFNLRLKHALAEVSERLLICTDIKEISDTVLAYCLEFTDSPIGFAGYVDVRSGGLISPTLISDDVWEHSQMTDKRYLPGMWRWISNYKEALIVNKLSSDLSSTGVPAEDIPIQRFLSVPCLYDDDLAGQIVLANRAAEYTEADLEVVQQFGMLYALAIQRMRAEEEIKARNRELSILNAIATTLNQSLDLEDILSSALDKTLGLMELKAGVIYLLGEPANKPELIDFKGTPAEFIAAIASLRVGEGITGRAVHSGEHIVVADISTPQDFVQLMKERAEEGMSFINFPLKAKDRVHGMMIVGSIIPCRFTLEEVRLLNSIGSQMGVAIENARLYALTEEQKGYAQTVLYSIADGVYTTDLTGRITSWNRGAAIITGYKTEEVIGKSCRSILNHVDEDGNNLCADRCPFMEYLQTGEPPPTQVAFIRTTDNRRVPVATSVAAVKDAGGNIIARVEVFRDISKEREIDRMKTNFVSAISHELRTPLASIQGFAEMLIDEDFEDEETAKEYLEIIVEESERLGKLIGNVLDLNNIESGKIKMDKTRLSLLDVIEGTVSLFSQQAEESNIKIDVKVADSLPRVEADEDMITQVMENLISNAIKYSPDGGLVTIKATVEANFVNVSVSDTGIGIPPDALDKVFERFYRVDDDRVRVAGGTGLGLALVKEMIEKHGGSIGLESELSKGSIFTFRLPATT